MTPSRILQVDFLDHSQGLGVPVPCRVYGLLVKDHPDYIVLEVWTVTDETLEVDDNENFCIIKAAITDTRQLNYGSPDHSAHTPHLTEAPGATEAPTRAEPGESESRSGPAFG